MPLPAQPVTLTVEQIASLNSKLSEMRHYINNQLAVIVASVEVGRMRPERLASMVASLVEQPPKVDAALRQFSLEFERALGITRA